MRIAVVGGAEALTVEVAKKLMELGHTIERADVILTPDEPARLRGATRDIAVLDQAMQARPVRFAHETEPARGYGMPRKSKADKLERQKKIQALQNGAYANKRRRK